MSFNPVYNSFHPHRFPNRVRVVSQSSSWTFLYFSQDRVPIYADGPSTRFPQKVGLQLGTLSQLSDNTSASPPSAFHSTTRIGTGVPCFRLWWRAPRDRGRDSARRSRCSRQLPCHTAQDQALVPQRVPADPGRTSCSICYVRARTVPARCAAGGGLHSLADCFLSLVPPCPSRGSPEWTPHLCKSGRTRWWGSAHRCRWSRTRPRARRSGPPLSPYTPIGGSPGSACPLPETPTLI